MTATYDGKLSVRDRAVLPCCAAIHVLIMRGHIYATTQGTVALRTDVKGKGMTIGFCPFCGAEVTA